jgi:predicted transcriptional regulator
MNKPEKVAPESHSDAEREAFLAHVDEGLADAKAGRLESYEKVRRWLLSWGTGKEQRPPKYM